MRVRQHVNPLKAEFLLGRAARLELPAGREIEVEVGCADAQFLFARALADPARMCVGIEIRRELVGPANARARETGLPVLAVDANATIELTRLFAPGSVARVFVNFPDPWFKKRHHKRRVLDAPMVAKIARVLRPGGELLFQSDVWEVALDAMVAIERDARLRNRLGPWSFWKGAHPFGARSRREEVCEAEGKKIWRMLYELGASSA